MPTFVRLTSTALLSLACACGGGGSSNPDARPGTDGGTTPSAIAHYQPFATGQGGPWGAIPYPSDLYLDSSGLLTLTTVPDGPAATAEFEMMLRDGLHTMNGAGVASGMYVPIDGEVDPDTLAGNVHIVDLDNGLAEIPVDLVFRSDIGEIVAVPQFGVALLQEHTYAGYVTDGVQATDGTALAADAPFQRVADLSTTPSDQGEADAQASLQPLLSQLGTDAPHVVSATVFKTESVTRVAEKMRDAVDANPPSVTVTQIVGPDATALNGIFGTQTADAAPGGLPSDGGRAQPHSKVKVLIHGMIGLPSFLSDTEGVDGFPTFDNSGTPQIKGTHQVKYTLILPDTTSWANLPVVIYYHGVNRTREDMITQADTVTRKGWALLAIDVPYHGSRANNAQDLRNMILNTDTPDGFGDDAGLFPAIGLFHLGKSGGIPGGHPQAMRENLRQTTMELLSLVSFVADGDVTPLKTALAGVGGLPADLSFRNQVGVVTESLGGFFVLPALALDPRIAVAAICSPASGFPFPSLMHSPFFHGTFVTAITNPFNIGDRLIIGDPVKDARWEPIVMLYNSILEQGEALGFAPYILGGSLRGDSGPDISMTMTWGDDTVPNDATESLAAMMGLPRLKTPAANVTPEPALRYVTLDELDGPIAGNQGGGNATAALTVLYPAPHAVARLFTGQLWYTPDFPPFTPYDPPLDVASPIVQVQAQWSAMFDDYFTGANDPPRITDTY